MQKQLTKYSIKYMQTESSIYFGEGSEGCKGNQVVAKGREVGCNSRGINVTEAGVLGGGSWAMEVGGRC